MQLNTRKINDPIKKCSKELNRHFPKEDIQIANKHLQRCSTSLIIREMQVKTTMRYHFMPDRMAAIKKSTNSKCWRGGEEKGPLLHSWWEWKLVQSLWRTESCCCCYVASVMSSSVLLHRWQPSRLLHSW